VEMRKLLQYIIAMSV